MTQVQRTVNFVNTHRQILTGISPRPNASIGAIIGGVTAAGLVLLLGAVFIWYLHKRRRSYQVSLRSALPFLTSEGNGPPPPKYFPLSARPMSVAAITQVPLPRTLMYTPT